MTCPGARDGSGGDESKRGTYEIGWPEAIGPHDLRTNHDGE
ncbi:MAG: hypothetical protein AVDCRST_MAG49-4114 [uncultured Thermomicrobiales bacterium]|uniref:Uncharacterized protein n=1 Tax=uncultured Thermomicrobiales bacterium TaxID=1645740 RepID=A0A6J4VCS4_9BACT|nr:MAG: hypothetical protein AVDCRST_MAG49-4114 [uncultured Thermomicrobiales bacterium]